MGFDQGTRNRLQSFVSKARELLEEEFTRQLQAEYGLDPDTGDVAELSTLRHLNDSQRETARILRDTLDHYCLSDGSNRKKGLDRIVREQAFTVLNRLAALRMAEARGLLVESVGSGLQAKGFQLYSRIAGSGLGETADAYRVYLFSVFDELASELPFLFDRHSPQGRLFPREPALLSTLGLVNEPDLEPIWAEDETIGWVYQYFNSGEERKAMRKASQAPRNSRELAVRNQFFTPRYVVEFLVDNTLGRMWLEETGGETKLRERCQYLLVKPDEQFQAPGKLRDPRSIKLLDPACGSMHFGLYAYDLFEAIYSEAWDWEQRHGPGSLVSGMRASSSEREPLSAKYGSRDAYLLDVPRLIIENNIYGVDIDPRAVQIASLALWLRAQRFWHERKIDANDRPSIGRGNVVAAIAPPNEQELRDKFSEGLDERDAELFKKTLNMLGALPEMGVTLRVEREIPSLIRKTYGEGKPLFASQDKDAWQAAEARLRDALFEFAQAANATYQGRLFASDALETLRIVDLCRLKFDVVVMNPPFGALASKTKNVLAKAYPRSKNDLLAIFVERGLELMQIGGRLGAITSRTCFFLTTYQKWREEVVLGMGHPEVMADLGHGVMDAAMVEAAAYVIRRQL